MVRRNSVGKYRRNSDNFAVNRNVVGIYRRTSNDYNDGGLQCIGNPKELKGRYGGSYVLTMTTAPEHAKDVEMLVQDVSPNARKLYHIAGTQKFEIPKEEVRISQVFQAVEKAKRSFKVFALADTTLEDVFIKVARRSDL
uniref:ABC transporter domain-containing protein n=1 Tax=Brassica oleracea var. oleracea TaxID=109376 RepID=A0A0D3A906_BRAOL